MTPDQIKAAAYDKLVANIEALRETHHSYEEPLSALDYVCTLNELFEQVQSVDYEVSATIEGQYPF